MLEEGILGVETLGVDVFASPILTELSLGLSVLLTGGFVGRGFGGRGFDGRAFGGAGFDGRGFGGASILTVAVVAAGFGSVTAGRSPLVRAGAETEMLSRCSMGAGGGGGGGGAETAGDEALTTGLAVMDCLRGSSAALTMGDGTAGLVATTTLAGTVIAPAVG